MSKGLKSPGGRAVSESAAQVRFDAFDVTSRLALSVQCAAEARALAEQIQQLALDLREQAVENFGQALAIDALACRIGDLADATYQALDEPDAPLADILKRAHRLDMGDQGTDRSALAERIAQAVAGMTATPAEAGQ